jgi:hypothetical protein
MGDYGSGSNHPWPQSIIDEAVAVLEPTPFVGVKRLIAEELANAAGSG